VKSHDVKGCVGGADVRKVSVLDATFPALVTSFFILCSAPLRKYINRYMHKNEGTCKLAYALAHSRGYKHGDHLKVGWPE
jgi:hypothetical protein